MSEEFLKGAWTTEEDQALIRLVEVCSVVGRLLQSNKTKSKASLSGTAQGSHKKSSLLCPSRAMQSSPVCCVQMQTVLAIYLHWVLLNLREQQSDCYIFMA